MTQNETKRISGSSHIVYLYIIGSVFFLFTILFLFFPRSKFSALEKRDLAEFPKIADYKDNLSGYTSDISAWFSDSEPYRDAFMTMSMGIRHALSYRQGDAEDAISYKPSETPMVSANDELSGEEGMEVEELNLADMNAKATNSGTIVVGSGPDVRALMAFGGSEKSGERLVKTAQAYSEAFPGVNIYTLVAPLATEFYLPEKGRRLSSPQKPVLDYIRLNLPSGVKFVDVYSALKPHVTENIYLRTDHHWAPLGAFYAARAFAKTAGVPFRELDSYDNRVIHNFVGSMYGYTKDIAVKNAPEDFILYTPRGLNYKSTFTTFNTDKGFHVTSASKPYESSFFKTFKDGSANAYLSFMGGDQHMVKVVTGTPSNRKVLIIKDSYGNAVPGYLFFSFGEVHVVDFRYFPYSLKEYVNSNGITDILLAFNIFNACNPSNMKRVMDLISHPTGFSSASQSKTESEGNKGTTPGSAEKSDEGVNAAPVVQPSEQTQESPKEPVKESPKEAAAPSGDE